MTTPQRDRSVDEQVYQSNKDEPELREVYSNEVSGGQDQPLIDADPMQPTKQDEASAESFPASDPAAPSIPTTATGAE